MLLSEAYMEMAMYKTPAHPITQVYINKNDLQSNNSSDNTKSINMRNRFHELRKP